MQGHAGQSRRSKTRCTRRRSLPDTALMAARDAPADARSSACASRDFTLLFRLFSCAAPALAALRAAASWRSSSAALLEDPCTCRTSTSRRGCRRACAQGSCSGRQAWLHACPAGRSWHTGCASIASCHKRNKGRRFSRSACLHGLQLRAQPEGFCLGAVRALGRLHGQQRLLVQLSPQQLHLLRICPSHVIKGGFTPLPSGWSQLFRASQAETQAATTEGMNTQKALQHTKMTASRMSASRLPTPAPAVTVIPGSTKSACEPCSVRRGAHLTGHLRHRQRAAWPAPPPPPAPAALLPHLPPPPPAHGRMPTPCYHRWSRLATRK